MTYQRNAYSPFKGLAETLTQTSGGPWVETSPVYSLPVTLERIQRWTIKSVTMFPADPLPVDGLVF